MDSLPGHLDRVRKLLASIRKPRLPSNPAGALRASPLVRGAIWLVGSALLGGMASEVSRREALSDWLRSHAPPRATWERALASHGWKQVSSPEILHRVLRSLPSRLDEPATVWLTRDTKWIALFESVEVDPVAFGRPGAPEKPKATELAGAWEPLGRGWPAFESLLERMAAARPEITRKTGRERPRNRDPREIVY